MLPLLAPLLSTLAANGLNILSSALLNKGKEVIEEKLGIDIETAAQTPEGLQKLRQLEIDHEEFLVNAAIENRKLDIQETQQLMDNTKSARDMNLGIQESAHASVLAKNLAYLLDMAVVAGTIILITLLYFKGIPAENKDIAYMALGSLLTMCGTIVNFHRGSSAGSKGKDDSQAKLLALIGSKK